MRCLFAGTALASLLVKPALAVWPAPQSFSNGTAALQLSPSFEIHSMGALADSAPAGLAAAIERASSQLSSDCFSRLVVDRGESDRDAVEKAPTLSRLVLSLESGEAGALADEIHQAYENRDEVYTLSIPATASSKRNKKRDGDGITATLFANSTLGLIRGLQTFTQLVYTLPSSETRYIPNAPIEISDAPAFPHRAFMLDTSRNFFPVDDIFRTLEAMASVKLSTLHWHATDSQSWPLFIPSFPNLTAGAYSSAEVYSWHDVYRVQDYAAGLGIDIMLEIDMPGHTASIYDTFPQYIACHEAAPWSTHANEPPAGQLRLGDNATLAFAKDVVKSVTSLSSSQYFSTGGDEVNELCYMEDPVTGGVMNSTGASLDDLLMTFVSGLHETVRAAGKTPVVWEEMVLDHPMGLENDTVVLVWVSSDNIVKVAEKGYRIIHAASDYFYLDCGHGGWVGNNVEGNSWCDPFKTWQKMYSFDPLGNLTESQQSLVLGGQSLVWTEQTSPQNLDQVVWPRAAAAAEVFWTGGNLEDGKRDVKEALPRLHDWRYRAVARGINAAPLQPHWCALRPQLCNVDA
ncbi:hypothetical protein JCM8547_005776 [Rhodosporidiobolus lusitaniae]